MEVLRRFRTFSIAVTKRLTMQQRRDNNRAMATYEELRDEAVLAYNKIYKDSLAFDMAEVPKELRIRLLEDEKYIMATKKIKAEMYAKQLKVLQDVINGEHSDPEKSNANEIIRALDLRNKLLFDDLNVDADESNALNIVMVAMTREDFDKIQTVEVNVYEGDQNASAAIEGGEFEEPKTAAEAVKGRRHS